MALSDWKTICSILYLVYVYLLCTRVCLVALSWVSALKVAN